MWRKFQHLNIKKSFFISISSFQKKKKVNIKHLFLHSFLFTVVKTLSLDVTVNNIVSTLHLNLNYEDYETYFQCKTLIYFFFHKEVRNTSSSLVFVSSLGDNEEHVLCIECCRRACFPDGNQVGSLFLGQVSFCLLLTLAVLTDTSGSHINCLLGSDRKRLYEDPYSIAQLQVLDRQSILVTVCN